MIEKYTKNARFCLICNYVSKIIPALQSRCTRFRFAPLAESQVSERVKHIAELEKYANVVYLFISRVEIASTRIYHAFPCLYDL